MSTRVDLENLRKEAKRKLESAMGQLQGLMGERLWYEIPEADRSHAKSLSKLARTLRQVLDPIEALENEIQQVRTKGGAR